MLSKILVTLSLGICLVSQCSQQFSKYEKGEKPKMIWSDEFDKDGAPDAAIWGYDIGDGCPHLCGWGNNELEYYTDNPENVRVKNGHLIIEAHKQEINGKSFSSTRLVSKNKKDWKYGKMEVRAKLPTGLGTWPAIWMLPTENEYGGWPHSGEIDVMEHVGYAKDTIYGTIHTNAYNHIIGTQKVGEIYVPDSESSFHTYAINWTPEKMEWYIDNVMYHSVKNEGLTSSEWPFDQKFYVVLNLAVGGNWGGKHGVAKDIWPQKMLIDYVRVYE